MAAPARAIVYIDGFNFYYGAIKGTPHKWLDLQDFCTKLLNQDDLILVRYFTSLCDGERLTRQLAFINALSTLPKVKICFGKFKTKDVKCLHRGCKFPGDRTFQTVEEKRTDVAIGIHMLDDAYADACDKLVLISGDSDLVPAIETVRRRFPNKKTIVYKPTRDPKMKPRRGDELAQASGDGRPLPVGLLSHCHLPPEVHDPRSGKTFKKPTAWT